MLVPRKRRNLRGKASLRGTALWKERPKTVNHLEKDGVGAWD